MRISTLPSNIYLDNIRMDLLQHNPELIPEVAKIAYEGIGKIWVPDMLLEHAVERYKNHLNDSTPPLTIIAFNNKVPVGICSLRVNDGIRSDLTPWLGSLVVIPEYQRLGIGKMLIDATKQKAHALGFSKLYLFAFDAAKTADYYTKLGWKAIGADIFKDHKVTVMEIEC